MALIKVPAVARSVRLSKIRLTFGVTLLSIVNIVPVVEEVRISFWRSVPLMVFLMPTTILFVPMSTVPLIRYAVSSCRVITPETGAGKSEREATEICLRTGAQSPLESLKNCPVSAAR